MSKNQVFISYRRNDSAGHSGRLFDRLSVEFPGRIFRDFEELAPGVDFHHEIRRALDAAKVIVVIIGKKWAGTSAGKNRIMQKEDFVRKEVGRALARKIRVVPVLVGVAELPRRDSLPASLLPLLRRQSLKLDEATFDDTVHKIVSVIEKELRAAGSSTRRNGLGARRHEDIFADRKRRERAALERSETARREIASLASPEKIIVYDVKVGRGSVQVINDDICQASTDVIVSSDDDKFTARGGVSKAILAKGGSGVRSELDSFARHRFSQGQVAITTGGSWERRALIHAVIVDNRQNLYPTLECIRSATRAALDCAVALGATSIAFPVLGAGYATTVKPTECVKAVAESIMAYLKTDVRATGLRVSLYIYKREDARGLPRDLLRRVAPLLVTDHAEP